MGDKCRTNSCHKNRLPLSVYRRLEGLILCAFISEVEKEHFTLFNWPTAENRQGRGRCWGGRGGGAVRLDMTLQLHGQHCPSQTAQLFTYHPEKYTQQPFLAVVNFGHGEEITGPTSGSSQRPGSDKMFPHEEPPPARPGIFSFFFLLNGKTTRCF